MFDEGGAMGQMSPASAGARGIGPGGLPMKKKLMPKASPKKLKENVGWKKSFGVYGQAKGKKKI